MSSRRRQKQQERMVRNIVYTVGIAIVAIPLLFLGLFSIMKNGNPCDLYGERDEIDDRPGWCSAIYGYDSVAIVVGNTPKFTSSKIRHEEQGNINRFFLSD